jgi:hypothetical protein
MRDLFHGQAHLSLSSTPIYNIYVHENYMAPPHIASTTIIYYPPAANNILLSCHDLIITVSAC